MKSLEQITVDDLPSDIEDILRLDKRIQVLKVYYGTDKFHTSSMSVADFIAGHNDAGFSLEFCLRLARTYAWKEDDVQTQP